MTTIDAPYDVNGPSDRSAFTSSLEDLLDAADGDVSAFQAQLSEQGAAFPDGERAAIVALLLAAPNPILTEAAIGWLLDPGRKHAEMPRQCCGTLRKLGVSARRCCGDC